MELLKLKYTYPEDILNFFDKVHTSLISFCRGRGLGEVKTPEKLELSISYEFEDYVKRVSVLIIENKMSITLLVESRSGIFNPIVKEFELPSTIEYISLTYFENISVIPVEKGHVKGSHYFDSPRKPDIVTFAYKHRNVLVKSESGELVEEKALWVTIQ